MLKNYEKYDSFDLLFDEKPGLYLGKIDDGYITIELWKLQNKNYKTQKTVL